MPGSSQTPTSRRRSSSTPSTRPPAEDAGQPLGLITEKDGIALAPTCWKKELLGATAQTGRAAQARLVPEHLWRAQNKLLRTRLEPSFIHGAPEALQHMQARAPHHVLPPHRFDWKLRAPHKTLLIKPIELELELILSHMTQKPMPMYQTGAPKYYS